MNRQGLVVARHRREILIETDDGSVLTSLQRGRRIRPVTGDEVQWSVQADGTAVVESILPRRTLLERIDSRGNAESVAANVSLLVVVVAPEPAPDWTLVDRYLAAAAMLDIDALLVRNKDDLPSNELASHIGIYDRMGYQVLATTSKPASGIDALRRVLKSHRSVLLGQSGVGKSSLLNALTGADTQSVGELSQRRKLGRHTTTSSILFRLSDSGELIDSPGVRRFAPSLGDPRELVHGFIEFRPYLGQCRFNDCRHEHEPVCGVLAALKRGDITAERYQSFVALRAILEQLQPS